MKRVVVVLSLVSSTAHAADTLPKTMQGKWASDPAACHEQSSELGLTVEPRTVLFYEHGFSIKRIVRQKDGSLKGLGYSFDEQDRARDTITLKRVGDKLRVRETTYHRCGDQKRR